MENGPDHTGHREISKAEDREKLQWLFGASKLVPCLQALNAGLGASLAAGLKVGATTRAEIPHKFQPA